MRLIDADRLLKITKFYNLKNGNRAIDEIDILHAPTVQAIPLDKIKQAREEIQKLVDMCGSDTVADLNMKSGLGLALEKIDKLIAESEGE